MSRRHFGKIAFVAGYFLSFFMVPNSHADIIMQTDENGTRIFSDHGPSFFGSGKTTPRKTPVMTENSKDKRFSDAINAAGKQHGVDPELIRCVISAESDFNKYAISRKGAHGLMQLTIPTASMYDVKNVYDPHENINGGAKHLKRLLDKFNGDLRLTLAAYNAGENMVLKYGGVPPFPETMQYVDRVINRYEGNWTPSRRYGHKRANYYWYERKNGSILITDTPQYLGGSSKIVTMENP